MNQSDKNLLTITLSCAFVVVFFITFIATDSSSHTVAMRIAFGLEGAMLLCGMGVFAGCGVGAILKFSEMIRYKNKDYSLSDAHPLNSFYMFSDAYLNEEGRKVRHEVIVNFFLCVATFILTILVEVFLRWIVTTLPPP